MNWLNWLLLFAPAAVILEIVAPEAEEPEATSSPKARKIRATRMSHLQ